jgi:hypothetical protein
MLLTYFKQLLVFAAAILLAACGGGGGDGDGDSSSSSVDTTTPSSVSTLSGVVADGYLRNARVFLDRNNNRVYDSGEPMSLSGAGGVYTLQVNPGEGDLYPVVVDVFAGEAVDEDGGASVADDYILEAPAGRWDFVSPLTTLVKQEMEKNPSYSETQAETRIRSSLGVEDTISLFEDYIHATATDSEGAEEYTRTHQVARIVASLMGTLRAEVTQNLGGQISDFDQSLVAYMISDQILAHAEQIEAALDTERNGGEAVNVGLLTRLVEDAIDVTQLDFELLDLYDDRLEQGLDLWDMQAPQMINQSPPANDSAPVDVIIEVTFDEALDADQITAAAIILSGPNGYVGGSIAHDVDLNTLTFTPDSFLVANSSYEVVVDEELSDDLGNQIGAGVSWDFTTIFDQLPPDLPDIE